uniref:Mitochondrial import inner membrane translocase subunit TIM50 n=1 Tax=Zosterops lateralis melanops TaxID=1220523 RepID=A0A8D2PQ31_ZOSLA
LPPLCQILIYTTAKKDYAKKLLEVAGSPRLCLPSRCCFSQSDCVCSQGCYWKDLACLGRDLAKVVALDHTMQGFPAQVPPWSGDPEDEELLRLIPALRGGDTNHLPGVLGQSRVPVPREGPSSPCPISAQGRGCRCASASP